jgi:hypothetical protein
MTKIVFKAEKVCESVLKPENVSNKLLKYEDVY